MKIDKAIKILSETVKLPENFPPTQYVEAIQMSIGALQQIAQIRLLGISPIAELLPGETEE